MPDFTRDRRGWFFRALAPQPEGKVLEVGEAFARNWFADVVRCEQLGSLGAQPGAATFDLILLQSLGGCPNLKNAIEQARGLLRVGGVLIVAGRNRFARRAARPAVASAPRATAWGLRAALSGAGFDALALYTVYPDIIDPIHVVDCHPLSARKFFGGLLGAQSRSAWSPKRLAAAALIKLNVRPYMQPDFIIRGRKC